MNSLRLWENIKKLSVDEFMCLLFEKKPGTIQFDYGDSKDWPDNAIPIYRLLTEDIKTRKLHVFFEDPSHDPCVNDYMSNIFSTDIPWWTDGKLYKNQLVNWLVENDIPSIFFCTAQSSSVNEEQEKNTESIKVVLAPNIISEGVKIADEANISNITPQTPNDSETIIKTKKKYRPRGDISAKEAAEILEVSERQVRNWDKGTNMPEGYPGRSDAISFEQFANSYLKRKNFKKMARAMNKAISGGGIADYFNKDTYDET